MDKIKYWSADLIGCLSGSLCWFSKSHCDYVATVLAMLIGFFTFFFITLPKVIEKIRATLMR